MTERDAARADTPPETQSEATCDLDAGQDAPATCDRETTQDGPATCDLAATRDGDGEEAVDEHLDNLPDGAGCTEIWEHLSERREADTDD